LTKAAALEEAPHQIRINAVCPGAIETEIWKTLPDEEVIRSALIAATPLKRIGVSAEVALPVAFLLSDAASYITATTLATTEE
jgi:3-oxoacyl-[acyl-carrier protein] reductase